MLEGRRPALKVKPEAEPREHDQGGEPECREAAPARAAETQGRTVTSSACELSLGLAAVKYIGIYGPQARLYGDK